VRRRPYFVDAQPMVGHANIGNGGGIDWRTVAVVPFGRGGRGITAMGGQRTKVEDGIDPSVGFVITARPGDIVRAGEPLATVFASDRVGVDAGLAALRVAITIADDAEPPLPLVSHRVTEAGVELYDASW
jgi:hypothetical protein